MSALPKCLLSLVIFLLAGLGQVSAHIPLSKNSNHGSEVSGVTSKAAFFVSRTSHREQQTHVLDVLIESETENELVSFKKRLENSHYPIDVCFGHTSPYGNLSRPKIALSNLYFSSDRCLLIRVFRI